MQSHINSLNRPESASYRFLASVSLPCLPAKLTPMPSTGEELGKGEGEFGFVK
jgi:hypothetical protein